MPGTEDADLHCRLLLYVFLLLARTLQPRNVTCLAARYAFVYECEGSPTGAKVIPILKTFMQHKRVNLKTLISDLVGTSPTVVACTVHFHTYNSTQGGEFTASNVAAFLKENQVLHITCSDPNTKVCICCVHT